MLLNIAKKPHVPKFVAFRREVAQKIRLFSLCVVAPLARRLLLGCSRKRLLNTAKKPHVLKFVAFWRKAAQKIRLVPLYPVAPLARRLLLGHARKSC